MYPFIIIVSIKVASASNYLTRKKLTKRRRKTTTTTRTTITAIFTI